MNNHIFDKTEQLNPIIPSPSHFLGDPGGWIPATNLYLSELTQSIVHINSAKNIIQNFKNKKILREIAANFFRGLAKIIRGTENPC